MPLTAFLFVTAAALAHATWNFLPKRAAHSKHLIWFSSVTEAVLFAPLALWVLRQAWPTAYKMAGVASRDQTRCRLRRSPPQFTTG